MTRPPTAKDDVVRLLAAGAEPDTLAIIWVTVDIDRVLAGIGATAVSVPDDPLLGAAVRLVRPPDEVPIALLEPRTEGRVAATLARSGEGPAGRYVAVADGLASVQARATGAEIVLSGVEDGPFGPSVLVLGGSAAAPYLVLVDRSAGTIDP
jgi:hypothetical protein